MKTNSNLENRTELLAPAGDLEKAIIALDYGADAVFLGAKAYSLRAHASNFDIPDIEKVVNYAHSLNKKVYLVTNIICHNALLKAAPEYLEKLVKCNPDGFITADPYIVNLLRKNHPEKEIHISTQQSVCNSKAALFWKRNAATRVVLAREVTYDELKLLMENLNHAVEIEIFIHGAVCISYSGRCMMSNNFSLRDANVGGCAQSCRWKYTIENDDVKNKSKFFTMSAKDMVQITNIKELLDLGVASFKIEGRMKSIHYVATVVNAYRKAIDNYYNGKDLSISSLEAELKKAANRDTDTAWMDGNPGYDKMLYHDEEKKLTQNYVFVIKGLTNNGYYEVLTKNHLTINDTLEIIGPSHDNVVCKITEMLDKDQHPITVCPTPMSTIYLKFETNVTLNYPDIARIIK